MTEEMPFGLEFHLPCFVGFEWNDEVVAVNPKEIRFKVVELVMNEARFAFVIPRLLYLTD